MKQFSLKWVSLLSVLILFSCSTSKNKDQQELDSTLNQVADWQIEHFTYSKDKNLHDYGIASWTNSVFYLGLAEWSKLSSQGDQYYDWLYQEIGESNGWEIAANFKNHPAYSLFHADELAMGQFYGVMYDKYKEDKIIQATQERVDWIMKAEPNEEMAYHNKQLWTWCDALFMAPPVYSKLALLNEEPRYLEYMHQRFEQTYNHLYDKEEKLFFRDSSYFNKKEANGAKIFWGRGNGWVVAGLCNILKSLPKDDAKYPFYLSLYRDMIDRLLEIRNPKGFWHASLLDAESYPTPETSATAMIAYAMAYGINTNLLDAAVYKAPLMETWNALTRFILEEGKLGYVQPIGADPKKVTADMTAVYGVGALLLAGSEIYKLK